MNAYNDACAEAKRKHLQRLGEIEAAERAEIQAAKRRASEAKIASERQRDMDLRAAVVTARQARDEAAAAKPSRKAYDVARKAINKRYGALLMAAKTQTEYRALLRKRGQELSELV